MSVATDESAALSLAVDLFRNLNEADVRYCHWKSTPNLAAAMRGKTDLDILVDENDRDLFQQVLVALDFKLALSHPSRQIPFLEDYLGFDRSSGNLVHLHVHYRLILGEQHVKNYHLPLERAFLNGKHVKDGVRVPAPELELVVLALRALLKYRDRDLLRDALHLGRSGGLRPSILRELRHLLAQSDVGRIDKLLQEELAFLSPGLILDFLVTIQNTPRSAGTLYRLRSQARRELAPFRRRGHWHSRLAYYLLAAMTEGPLPRLSSRLRDAARNRKYPAKGGLTVAFIGADGSGKSTLAERLSQWLSWKLSVRTYYMGLNQPSFVARGLKAMRRGFLIAHAGCRRLFGVTSPVTRLADVPRQLSTHLLQVAQAWDRRTRYEVGRRQAAQGTLVVYDRYPLRDAFLADGPIDGPRISTTVSGWGSSISSALSRRERRLYDRIPPADHYFVLHVNPDIAHERKLDHKRTTVEANARAIEMMALDDYSHTHIDADQPLEVVLLQVKTALWHLL